MNQVQKLAARYLNQGLSLTDPIFNLREITKQMLLLEDHLFHPNKECSDCIIKHLLTIEALADEGMTFNAGPHQAFEIIIKVVQQALVMLHDGAPHADLGMVIRKLRKTLAPAVFDPRAIAKEQAGPPKGAG